MDLSKLSDSDLYALQSGDMSKVSDEGLKILSGTPTKEEPGMIRKGIDYGLRGLDYLGGLARGTAAGIGELATGKELVNLEEVLRGQAPSTSEILQRGGVGEMGRLSEAIPSAFTTEQQWTGGFPKPTKGGVLDITGRGAVGLASDIALDPLTYATFGASAAQKAGMGNKAVRGVLTPTKALAEPMGKSFYKSALGRIDEEAMKYGKEPVSDLLLKNRISGSAEKIYGKMDDLAEKLLNEQRDILSRATKAGGSVSMKNAMHEAQQKIAILRASDDPLMQPIANALEDAVKTYTDLDPRLIQKTTPEYLGKAKAYELEKSKYLEDVKKYRAARSEYKKAGGTDFQDMLPGQTEIGQTPGTVQKELSLSGPDISMQAEKVTQEPFQYSLMEVPQKKVNVKGGRSEKTIDNLKKYSQEIQNQEPKFGMQQIGIENYEPSQFEKALVELPSVQQAPAGYQTSMILEPPTRPTRPVRPEVPMEWTAAMTPEKASGMKTSLYESLPRGTYQETMAAAMGTHPELTRGKKAMAKGIKEETESSIGQALGKAEQERLIQTNKELGQLLTSKDKQLAQAFIENRKPAVTQVGAGMLGAAAKSTGQSQAAIMAALAAKEAVRALQFTGPRTALGKGMYYYGKEGSPIWDILLRQSAIEKNRSEGE